MATPFATHDTNLNSAQCIKTVSNFGEDIIHNICTGTQVVIDWGVMDYAVVIGLGSLFVTMGAIIFGVGAVFLRDAFRHY